MNKQKVAKFLIVILIIFIAFILCNKKLNLLKENTYMINAIQIKEELLKQRNKANSMEMSGTISLQNINDKHEDIELSLYRKNEDEEYEKIDITYTDDNGNYKFSNLDEGIYNIKIVDGDQYKLITQLNDIELTKSIDNIDIELKKSEIFNAEIKKYIKEVKIVDKNGEKIYEYDKQNKVNISIKNINNVTGSIKYEFEITNTTNKEGYVKIIKDTIPEGLSFDGNKNKEWKEKNGEVYTTQLSKEIFKAGENKKIELELDIKNINEGKNYLNKVSVIGEAYHKLTYINIDDIYSEIQILDGDTAQKEIIPVREGYVFKGWFKDKETTKKFDFSEPITKDTKIYAGWKKLININYIIDERSYFNETIEEGEKTTKPSDPTIEGYTFNGWYSDEKFNNEFNFDNELVSDTNIYGKITKNIQKYKVTYKIYDDKTDKWYIWKNSEVINGGVATDEIGPEKDSIELEGRMINYQFDKWYNNESFTEVYDFKTAVTSNIILYGKYEEAKTCITKENNKILTKEQIIENVETKYKTIDLNALNTNIKHGVDDLENEYIIANGFKLEYYDDTKTSFRIIDYVNEDIPDEIIVPDTVNNIPIISLSNGFSNKIFKNVILSKTLKYIEGEGFKNSIIENIDFSNSINLEKIGEYAFSKIQTDKFDLSNSVNLLSIENNVFNGSYIKSFEFSNTVSLETIEENAYSNAEIYNIDFGNSINLNNISSLAFYKSKLNIDILDMTKLFSLKKIDVSTFSYAGTIKKILFSSYVEVIDSNSFNFSNIEFVDFECAYNLQEIGFQAFKDNNIKEIEFKNLDNLSTIRDDAFSNNNIKQFKIENLKQINHIGSYILENNPLELLSLKNLQNLSVITPQYDRIGNKEVEFDLVIDNVAITKISDDFMKNANISTITLENLQNLETIDERSFSTIESLTQITMKNLPNLTEIMNSAFFQNGTTEGKLEELTLENLPSLSEIGDDAFLWNNLKKVVLRNLQKLENIGSRTFETQGSLNTIILENLPSLTTIDQRAFYDCNINKLELNGQELPKLTSIKNLAFYSDNISEVILKDLPLLNSNSTDAIGNIIGSKNLQKIELDNLPNFYNLNSPLANGAIQQLIIKNCEKITFQNSNISYNINELILENLPSVTTIGNFPGNNITNLDLSKLTNLKIIREDAFRYSKIKHLNLSGLKLEKIGMGAFTDNLIEDIDLSNTQINEISSGMFNNNTIKDINFTNSKISSINDGAFAGSSISKLDLSEVNGLTKLGNGAFSGNPLTVIKLPESLIYIGNYSLYSSSSIECIEIQGDNTRFNDIWSKIGLPENLTPSTCIINDNISQISSQNILANIFLSNDSNEIDKTYNIVLYKMDDLKLIDDSKTYKLQILNVDNYEDISVFEDYDNLGRYIVNPEKNDFINSYNNKIYISNIEKGIYRLIDTGNENNTLNFVIEENGVLTGNVKISDVGNKNNIMSTSESELMISIQTGLIKGRYAILLTLIGIIGILLYLIRIKKYKL